MELVLSELTHLILTKYPYEVHMIIHTILEWRKERHREVK